MTDSKPPATDMVSRIAEVHFKHYLAEVSPAGHAYCACSKFHPLQGIWAHSSHVALEITTALGLAVAR